VNIEMGGADAGDSGTAFGGLLAFSLAEAGDGLVWLFDRDWVAPGERAVTVWAPEA
jgi:hypothetical protein